MPATAAPAAPAGGLVDASGRPLRSEPRRRASQAEVRAAFRRNVARLEARYDAAQTTVHNERHWAQADLLDAAAAANPAVRAKLRSRARYECHEANSWAKGIAQTLAVDTIGRGPRLQLQTENERHNQQVSRSFNRWAVQVLLARRLRTARLSKGIDGEAFILQRTNRRLRHPVKLDLRLIEGDQVATPDYDGMDPDAVDGIRFDADGVPAEYHVLRSHPGTDRPVAGGPLEYDPIDASQVVHWYREDRPNQHRGIPEFTCSLPLFAQLRRYTLAVIAAAETAAEFAAVMYTDAPGVDIDTDVQPMDAIELEMRSMLTLPSGWKLGQIDAKHPTTTYPQFVRQIIGEVARGLGMPLARALGDSSGFTYASGKLDRDAYLDVLTVERHDCETVVLDTLLAWWLAEASLIPGLLPAALEYQAELPEHTWQWDGFRETDANRQAAADAVYWEIGLLTDEDILQRRGVDQHEHDKRLQRQQERRRRMGLPLPGEKDRDPDKANAATVAAEDRAESGAAA